MRALVTGAAGFIGSHLAEGLVARGVDVIGIDRFTDAYSPEQKRDNVSGLLASEHFDLIEEDLRAVDVGDLLDGVEVVFHQAAVPGVRASWSERFKDYLENNVLATHRLLEGAIQSDIRRFIYASSSSVYGDAERYPTMESDNPKPHSPYGVTKLAAENLCVAYARNFDLHTVSLRYFSVYGPRQRPDMGIHRVIEAALGRGKFSVFGTGEQVRDFTYVQDVVEANLLAADAKTAPGTVLNIAGGSSASLNSVIETVGEILGSPVPVRHVERQPGDVARTGGGTDAARQQLRWDPKVALELGLRKQIEWHQHNASLLVAS